MFLGWKNVSEPSWSLSIFMAHLSEALQGVPQLCPLNCVIPSVPASALGNLCYFHFIA